MIWPIMWMTAMLGLVIATIVAAMREKKARVKAMARMQPQPMGDPAFEADEAGTDDDAFGGAGFDDGFGDAADPLAAMDDEAFK